jgi:hypothetical protein
MKINKQCLLTAFVVLISGAAVIVLPSFRTGAAAGRVTWQRDENGLHEMFRKQGFDNFDIRTDGRTRRRRRFSPRRKSGRPGVDGLPSKLQF